jgi:hypothetical protein
MNDCKTQEDQSKSSVIKCLAISPPSYQAGEDNSPLLGERLPHALMTARMSILGENIQARIHIQAETKSRPSTEEYTHNQFDAYPALAILEQKDSGS